MSFSETICYFDFRVKNLSDGEMGKGRKVRGGMGDS
jgi:hypothetical protein